MPRSARKSTADPGKALVRRSRRGAAAVYLAISMTVVFGMAALAVDVGLLYSAQAELQRSADAAALAAAAQLVTGGGAQMESDAFDAADEFARRNLVLNVEPGLSVGSDVELGRAIFDSAAERYLFQPGPPPYDAVKVTVRRTEDSEAGPVALSFARLLGHEKRGLAAEAVAMMIPRDIAVVIDLSNSMNWDSQLRFWDRDDGGYANTRDVWAALDGPEPSRPYLPGPESATEYAGIGGPTIGVMTEWGDPLLPGAYNAFNDPGLFHIPRNQNTTDARLATLLAERGYSADERSILLSGNRDGTASHWRNRVGVLLGLGEWRSGRTGGKFPSGGNGDAVLNNNEMVWSSYPPFRIGGWTWTTYVNWVATGAAYGNNGRPEFRNRYGLKTFTDFLLEGYPERHRTNILWATPQQPLRATKDAVQTMVNVITELDSLDHLSLEIFASTSRHEVNLTGDLQEIADVLYERQSGHYDRATNIAGGLVRAINELQSGRARPNAKKYIVLMSDGVANTDEQGNHLGDFHPAARQYALDRAQQAADLGFRIFTVSVGYWVDRDLMREIAAIGKGEEFYAAGSPEEYTEQLEAIFRSLGGKRPVVLIE